VNAYRLAFGPEICIAERIERTHESAHSGDTGAAAELRSKRAKRAFHEREAAQLDWEINVLTGDYFKHSRLRGGTRRIGW